MTMANPEIEIYKSGRRFSDYTKDAVVNSVVEKLRDSQNNIEEAALSEIVHLIESTFESSLSILFTATTIGTFADLA